MERKWLSIPAKYVEQINAAVEKAAAVQWFDPIKARRVAITFFPDANETMLAGIVKEARRKWKENSEGRRCK